MTLRLVLAAALLLWGRPGLAQLSPGDLSKPHAELDGIRSCTKCHGAGQKLSPDKCFGCHKQLGTRVGDKSGFHGHLPEEKRQSCQSCHHEHQGRDFALIEWPAGRDRFLHDETGWPLHGKHDKTECKDCHEPRKVIADDVAKHLKETPTWSTFLGLGRACTNCHFDEHRGQLGDKCESCHNESKWRPAPGFDHQKPPYPLIGLHKKVACVKCHSSESGKVASSTFPGPLHTDFSRWTPIDHGSCTSCHQDAHQNRFGQRCESCHSPEGWHGLKQNAQERVFHDQTRFPLQGAHATVGCAACHGPFGKQPAKWKGLPFATCTACHDDAHAGQLSAPACERCHDVSGFSPARFEAADHKTFPLAGAHLATPCSACHKADAALFRRAKPSAPGRVALASGFVFRGQKDSGRCESCHKDPHGGEFKTRPDGCASCHLVASFHQPRFDHSSASFPLAGRHQAAACAACHLEQKGSVRFDGARRACAGCHADIHLGQFGEKSCDTCHNTETFTETLFAHESPRFTSFHLDGKHDRLACAACHPTIAVQKNVSVIRYRPTPKACEGCHKDPHHGEFKGFEP